MHGCNSPPPIILSGPTFTNVYRDFAQPCARQSVQREKSHRLLSFVLQSHNCNSPSLRVRSGLFLIFSISGLHLCLHIGINPAQQVYHLSRIICKHPISPVVKRSVLVEHGQKQPYTYRLEPEDNKQEPQG